MKEAIKIFNRWIVEIDAEERSKTYNITKVSAFFGYGIWLPIDTTGFTQEQWDLFHQALEATGR